LHLSKAAAKAGSKRSTAIVACVDQAARLLVWPPSSRRDSLTTSMEVRRSSSPGAYSIAERDLRGMMRSMTTSKIAVSLPTDVLRSAQRAVAKGRSPSVSAYVAAAILEKSKLDDLAALLDEMLADTGGPLTASERRAADRALRPSKRIRRSVA